MKVVLLPLSAVFVALSAANVLADTHADTHVDAHANTHQIAIKSVATEAEAATKTVAKVAKKASQEIIVTATRTEKLAKKALASVSVLTEQDIERLQPTDMVDLLNHLPSVSINTTGSMGSKSSLFTRGTSGSHTLILLDGQRINSATSGDASFQHLDPSQIERIEVVRGGRSSIYGSDAIGGVIQIFTKKGTSAPQTQLSTEVGSNALRKYMASTRGKLGDFRYAVNGSYLDINGFDSQKPDTGTKRDHDGHRNKSLSGNFGYTFNENIDLSLNLFETNTRTYYDGSILRDDFVDRRIQNISTKLSANVTDWWKVTLLAGRAVDDGDNIDALTKDNTGHFLTKRRTYGWQNDFSFLDNHLVTVGWDFYNDRLTSSTQYVDEKGERADDRFNRAVFARYQGQFQHLDIQLGIREDDNEAYGSHTTGNIAVGYQFDDAHRGYLSWSEGFRAPTFNDLFFPGFGNPDVLPEESENYELGVSGDYSSWAWNLSVYRNRIDNLITFTFGPLGFAPYNVGEAIVKGGELVVTADVMGWQLSASASLITPEDRERNKTLILRPKRSVKLDADKDFGRWNAGISVNAQGKRYTNESNTENFDGYTLLDARVGYDITEKFKAQFQFNNMLNKHYRTNGKFTKFNEDGANWTLKLTYQL